MYPSGYRYRPLTKSGALGIGLLFAFLIGGLGVLSINDGNRKANLFADLQAHGVREEGVVVGHEQKNVRNPQNGYYLDVRFPAIAPDSKDFNVTSADYFRLSDGAKVTVAYLKDDNTKAEIVGTSPPKPPLNDRNIGVGMVIFAALLLIGAILYAVKGPPDSY